MSEQEDWWPRREPTLFERCLAAVFLITFIPLVVSAVNNWRLLGLYDKPALVTVGLLFFLVVVRPLIIGLPGPRQQASYAAKSIRGFLDGSADPCAWDDFTSCSFSDPAIDSIRLRAATVDLPVSTSDRLLLAALAGEAEAIVSANPR